MGPSSFAELDDSGDGVGLVFGVSFEEPLSLLCLNFSRRIESLLLLLLLGCSELDALVEREVKPRRAQVVVCDCGLKTGEKREYERVRRALVFPLMLFRCFLRTFCLGFRRYKVGAPWFYYLSSSLERVLFFYYSLIFLKLINFLLYMRNDQIP